MAELDEALEKIQELEDRNQELEETLNSIADLLIEAGILDDETEDDDDPDEQML